MEKMEIKELGKFSLKGVEQQQELAQISPLSLAHRTFPPIVSASSGMLCFLETNAIDCITNYDLSLFRYRYC